MKKSKIKRKREKKNWKIWINEKGGEFMKDLSKDISEGKMVDELYMIPYISHCRRMAKVYRREKKLKILLVGSNLLWLIWLILSFVVG